MRHEFYSIRSRSLPVCLGLALPPHAGIVVVTSLTGRNPTCYLLGGLDPYLSLPPAPSPAAHAASISPLDLSRAAHGCSVQSSSPHRPPAVAARTHAGFASRGRPVGRDLIQPAGHGDKLSSLLNPRQKQARLDLRSWQRPLFHPSSCFTGKPGRPAARPRATVEPPHGRRISPVSSWLANTN